MSEGRGELIKHFITLNRPGAAAANKKQMQTVES